MMLAYRGAKVQRKRWLTGGGLIAALGVLLTATPLGDWFATLSYDVPFLFRGNIADTNVVVVLEDRASLDALGEKSWPPSRTVHARLLDRLREEGARLVVFDILFRSERPGEDEFFAAAIKRHGNVILGCVPETSVHRVGDLPGTELAEFKPPTDALRTNAAGWGLLLVGNLDASQGVRKMTTVWRGMEAAIWLAAQRAGGMPAAEKADAERWISFYGAPPALDRVRLGEALQLEGRRLSPGFLRGKIVFVGFDPSVTPASGARDLFATPYTRFGHDFAPGVEVLANAYANLVIGDWLERVAAPVQCALVSVWGIGATLLLIGLGRRWLLPAALVLLVALIVLSFLVQWRWALWWNWLVPATVQLPLAVLLVYLCPHLPVVAFISYRREGGHSLAWGLLQALRLRGMDAFLDVGGMGPGDFPAHLRNMIERLPNFVLILSPGALDDRIAREEDWLRKEISHALVHGKNIIPILIDDFDFAQATKLPPELERLPEFNSIIHHRDRPDATADNLQKFLLAGRR